MEQRELKILRIKSLIIVSFLSKYSELEDILKNTFQREILQIEHRHKSKLYFMYGCSSVSAYYDIDKERISLANNRSYSDDEVFKSLTMDKLIKYDRKEKLIHSFNFEIQLKQNKVISVTFHDCCIKLTKMRNILAHEIINCTFTDKEVIEKLSDGYISTLDYEWFEDGDISIMDDSSKSIISNYSFMCDLISKLNQHNYNYMNSSNDKEGNC